MEKRLKEGIPASEDYPAADRPTARGSDTSRRRLLPLVWPLFVVMWLVFPVASVFDMLGTNLTLVRLLAFLILMVAYVADYPWLMLRFPFRSGESSPRERRVQVALLATLTALALCLEVTYGTGILYLFLTSP